ncbi:MAG: zinc ribbon domain-containing protein [Acidobacteriota bacterium]|nr:zinc ribbon domain-containing protein [Acidobacteriota bacterium]
MPIYEYRCEQCGDLFDVRQNFKDEPVTVHDKCGGHVVRLLSVPALQFKGSGFYINDYAKGNSGSGNSPAKSEGSSAKDGALASNNSGEKATAPPAETKTASSDSKKGK